MAKVQEFYLTEEGLAKLKADLEELKGPKRIELAKRLRVAIQQGDLSENADYKTAKEDQGFLEGRIQEIEIMLRSVVIITEASSSDGVVAIGSKVRIEEEGREPVDYLMVGATEADPRNGRISNESPIGMALLGHRVGDSVEVETPAGVLNFKIAKVE
jgi:transcription elongation factor GreA